MRCPSVLSGPKATAGSSILDDVTGNYGFRTKAVQVGPSRKALSYRLLARSLHFLYLSHKRADKLVIFTAPPTQMLPSNKIRTTSTGTT